MGISSWNKAWLLVFGVSAGLIAIGPVAATVAFVSFSTEAIFWLIVYVAIAWEAFVIPSLIAYLAFSLRVLRESERGVVEVFGKYNRTLFPGLHIVLRGVEVIVHPRQTTKEQYVSVDTKNTITFDKDTASFIATLYYVLNPDDPYAAYRATYAFETEEEDREEAIKKLSEGALRSIAGTKELSYLQNNQTELNALVLEKISEKMLSWGFVVKDHVIEELIPSKEVGDAIKKKLIADAEGAALVATATANKLATIESAEGDKQKRIKAAEANKEEQVLDAAGEAARLKAIGETLGGPQQAMAFHLGEKAVESLGKAGTTVIGLPAGDLLGGVTTVVAGVMKAIADQPTPTPPSTR